MARRSTIAEAALEIINSAGPQESLTLAGQLADRSLIRSRAPERSLLSAIAYDTRFVRASDGRWHSLPEQLDGAFLMHRLTSFERRYDLILLGQSDWLLSRFVDGPHGIRSGDGAPLFVTRIEEVFDLPEPEWDEEPWLASSSPHIGISTDDATINFLNARRWDSVLMAGLGWLDAVQDGQLVAFRVFEGAIVLQPVRDQDVSAGDVAGVVDFLRKTARGHADQSNGLSVEKLMTAIITEASDLLKHPLMPFDELAASAGLVLDSGVIDLRRRHLAGTDVAEVRNDHYYDHVATRMTATDAKARLLALLDRVGAGEEIEITRHGRTVARLVPAAGSAALRGSLAGIASSAADDAHLYSTEESWDAA